MRILILHPGALGDVILSLPAVAHLRRFYPGAEITFAGNPDHLEFLLAGYAESVRSLSALPLYRLYSSELPFESDRCFWNSYDLIISWTGSASADFVRNLHALHPNAHISPWHPASGDARHVSRIFIESLPIPVPSNEDLEAPRVCPEAGACEDGRAWLMEQGWDGDAPLLMLHPGSGAAWKRWPLGNFSALARRLAHSGTWRLILMEGPAERGDARRIADAMPGFPVMVCDSAPLKRLSGILAHCRIFVGNDSGATHLAAALDVSCVALFGPTSPVHWAPRGRRVAVLKDSSGCQGCVSETSGHTCLANIAVDAVYEQIRRLAGESRAEEPAGIGDVDDEQKASLPAVDAARAPESIAHDE